jgi:uncharacterized protein
MSWVVVKGRVLASAEVAESREQRLRGFLGRDGADGAMVIPNCKWIHTLGMRFALDVAYVDRDGIVIRVLRVRRNRMTMPVWAAHTIIEAEAGAFSRWALQVGDHIEIRS